MRDINTIRISAICPAPEQRVEIKKIFETIIDSEIKEEIKYEDLKENNLDTLYIIKLRFKKNSQVKKIQHWLLSKLSEKEIDILKKQASERLDEKYNYYFRLEKESFLTEKAKVVEKGDVLQFRMNVAAHPKNKETVVKKVHEIFSKKELEKR